VRLTDKVAIITGAASGIGRACAIVFAGEGAKIIAADINDAGGQETVATIKSNGGEAVFVHTDVSLASDAENLIMVAEEKYGRIDILLNVAGILHSNIPIEEIDDAMWDKIYAVNVKGIFHTVKYAVPLMKAARSGTIINVASMGGINPRPGGSAYTSSKGAVITLTKEIALELMPYHIRVNCINPEGTDTAMALSIAPADADPVETRKEIISQIPLGRFIKPEEIAYAAVYLASDEALMLSGTHIDVNAGYI
jgi:3-oxoacyl-[acyl-carrier protein] reductase